MFGGERRLEWGPAQLAAIKEKGRKGRHNLITSNCGALRILDQ